MPRVPALEVLRALTVVASAIVVAFGDREISYSVEEETNVKASVGNLWVSLGSQGRSQAFRVMPQSPYFAIDSSGNVRIESRIDREDPAACPQASDSTPCVIDLNAFANDAAEGVPLRTVVRITIRDINDNWPTFKTPIQEVFIEEGDAYFRNPLDPASDADIGENGMLGMAARYSLVGGEGVFALDQSQRGLLYLVSADGGQPLDYEKRREHALNLTACDGARLNRKCSSRRLIVRVHDRNDNSPNVTSDRWPDAPENLTVGGEVARVEATDLDSGENGRLTFQISEGNAAKTFAIDPSSGRVTLQKRLNARVKADYEVKVLVSDNGTPRRETVASFYLHVLDVNDHAPTIRILPMMPRPRSTSSPTMAGSRGSPSPSTELTVRENAKPGASLALIQVLDEDLGDNARTTCQLTDGSSYFRLEMSGTKDYQLHSVGKLDFETTPTMVTRIECRDQGIPSQFSGQTVPIRVVNENEFAPTFSKDMLFNATIVEYNSLASGSEQTGGTFLGRQILTVSAEDRDRDEQLTFELSNDGSDRFFEVIPGQSRFFAQLGLTRGTGVLQVKAPIDRDTLRLPSDLIILCLVVKDSPDDSGTRHSASVSLTVSVADLNDNPPEIISPKIFRVLENSPTDTVAVSTPDGDDRLRVQDPDLGVNAQVTFQLLDVRAATTDGGGLFLRPDPRPFTVTADGQIRTALVLDREQHALYLLTVSATNFEARPKLSTTAEITVRIGDQNDSPPVWSFPKEPNLYVNISTAHRLNDDVTWVQAVDPDESSNVTYRLVSVDGISATNILDGPATSFLTVDAATGVIRLANQPTPGPHEVTVRAFDADRPSAFVDTQIVVNVLRQSGGGLGGARGDLRDAQINLSIIVGMIAATGLVSVCLISAIVCVRRRSSNSFSASNSGSGGRVGGGGGGGVGVGSFEKEAPCEFHPFAADALDDCHFAAPPEHLLYATGGLTVSGLGGSCRSTLRTRGIGAGVTSPARHHQLHMTTFCQSGCEQMQQQSFYHHPQLQHLMARNEEPDGADSADSGRGGSEDGIAIMMAQHPQGGHGYSYLNAQPPSQATLLASRSLVCHYPSVLEEDTTAPAATSMQNHRLSRSSLFDNREKLC